MSKTLTISIMNKEFQVACPEGEEKPCSGRLAT